MPVIHIPESWRISEREVTPEEIFWNRRAFIKALGAGTIAAASLAAGCTLGQSTGAAPLPPQPPDPTLDLYPAKRNAAYSDAGRPLTPANIAGRYNNYYEFTTDKERVAEMAAGFRTRPWTVQIAGLVEKPGTYDIDKLIRSFPLEERVYRFRCVEAWAMTVPWTGFPLAKLVDQARPLSSAKFVRFVSLLAPDRMPGQKSQAWYQWPYYEALRMDEARNELTLCVTGIYGKPLPPQHGAPLRIITPWKYGYKSPKAIVRIEFVPNQPRTFWNDVAPNEYSFLSNVDPTHPHPRWSQATERLIDNGQRIPTQMFNGYGDQVAAMYKG